MMLGRSFAIGTDCTFHILVGLFMCLLAALFRCRGIGQQKGEVWKLLCSHSLYDIKRDRVG